MLTITSTEFTNPNVQQTLKNPPTSLIKDLRKAYTGPLVCRLKKKTPQRDTGGPKLCLRVSRKGPLTVLPQSSQLLSSQKARVTPCV